MSGGNFIEHLFFFLIVSAVSFGGTFVYKILVSKYFIVQPNYRSLHKLPTPTGAGIVFSLVFVCAIYFIFGPFEAGAELLTLLCLGGAAVTLFGLLDDMVDLKASTKLFSQLLLAGLCVYHLRVYFHSYDGSLLYFFAMFTAIFIVVWMMNAYNFIDGIDGLAASGAIIISVTIYLSLLLSGSDAMVTTIFLLIFAAVSGFAYFNWPPASIFMGDSGSMFLGYIFAVLLLFTVLSGVLSIWTWLTVFGYFLVDTTVTQIVRVLFVNKWWRPHRSHAYQNIARISGSHIKTISGVVLYHLLWILPLTLLTVFIPDYASIITLIALSPALVVAFKFGPRYSAS